MRFIPLLFFGLATSASSQRVSNQDQLAADLVARMQLQRGERVLLVAVRGYSDELIPLLRRGIVAAGAIDLGVLASSGETDPTWATDFTRAAPKDRAGLATYLSTVDLAVMMPGAGVQDAAYAAMQDVLRSNKGRTIHFHWAGAYSLEGRSVPMGGEKERHYQRALRSTDYEALSMLQTEFERVARNAPIRVTTPAGTDITFRIGDRPVTKQDGDASAARARMARNLIDREVELPAGAIRVAPLEESVNGQIVFPRGEWASALVFDLTLRIVNGRVTEISTRNNSEFVDRELTQGGEGARSFREFALGFNPLLSIRSTGYTWIPYYGYGAGVVRLSLGDNTELGGRVGGGYVRWNFFTDATVMIGDEVWVKSGVLVKTMPR
jgi:leucyl aminopeptidase (aminopeptidase T)